jgi:methylated-DNA-protein-cysteine methyltransferase-like protein
MTSTFTQNVIKIIQSIPNGKILTYGMIARLAGDPRGARQVSWILHSSSKKYDLPWHRVINSKGLIALNTTEDKEYQKSLLKKEGITFISEYKVDLKKHMWNIESSFYLK